MWTPTRRDVMRAGAGIAAGAALLGRGARGAGAADDAEPRDASVEVLHPRGRVPLSFVIDDSTCLVNMGHFCMPQFAEAWPQRPEYRRPWRAFPREIPDAFVREFGEWCAARGVKGKYSLVPYPACVGWLDRGLPGWSHRDLRDSLNLVRELMVPHWDIHPEMVTHTRVIDLKTGRPLDPVGPATMENWYPEGRKSADELAAYIAYALRILKNCDIPCAGVTTPGGFGNAVKPELSLAIRQAVDDVFAPEIPHYFKYVIEGEESVAPKLENVEWPGKPGDGKPRLVVNVPAGTGDWFGGWDGGLPPQGHKYAADDAGAGRMVELIERGEPAVMLCHWAGLYSNGNKAGFAAFKKVVEALDARFRDRTRWMKLSEIARYWAARELTGVQRDGGTLRLTAPFACPDFTLKVTQSGEPRPPAGTHEGKPIVLEEVADAAALKAGTWMRRAGERAVVVCFDLPAGQLTLAV
jgi:hypothetical protein